MATTHIFNKLQDTSIYINLSSQNLHSAIAALKQEAKPLTTLNIKGFGDTKKRELKGKGIVKETRQRMTMMMMMEKGTLLSEERDGISAGHGETE